MNGIEKLIRECDQNISFYSQEIKFLKTAQINGEDNISIRALITISLLDLSVILKNICLANTDWERIFFSKHGYLIIHETIVRLRPYNSVPDIKQKIDCKYPHLKSEYESVQNRIEEFKAQPIYKEKIVKSRNYIAAHIDKRFKKYYETAFNSDCDETAVSILHFLEILKDMNIIMNSLPISSTI